MMADVWWCRSGLMLHWWISWFSLTFLLGVLRSFRRFTIHYILHCVLFMQFIDVGQWEVSNSTGSRKDSHQHVDSSGLCQCHLCQGQSLGRCRQVSQTISLFRGVYWLKPPEIHWQNFFILSNLTLYSAATSNGSPIEIVSWVRLWAEKFWNSLFLLFLILPLIASCHEMYFCLQSKTIPCSFIRSGYFYSASSSPLLFSGTPDYIIDTVLELIHWNVTGICEWRTCPRSLRGG